MFMCRLWGIWVWSECECGIYGGHRHTCMFTYVFNQLADDGIVEVVNVLPLNILHGGMNKHTCTCTYNYTTAYMSMYNVNVTQ